MYCTLEEAYNIPPSQGTKKKNTLRSPVRAAAVDPSISAEPYDRCSPGMGKELASAYRKYGQEDFVNIPAGPGMSNPMANPSYVSKRNDYKYYCDQYNVCAPGMAEDFQDLGVSKAAASKSNNKKACGPLQPPMYEIPIDEDAKNAYKDAMNVAMSQEQTALPPKPKRREVDMSKVDGYYDEDLEQYLETKDMKASPIPVAPALPKKDLNALPYDPAASPFSEAMNDINQKSNRVEVLGKTFVERLAPTSRDTKGMWLDLMLFFAIGVLFVVLADQLVRFGMMLGMKRTVEMLTPLLENRNIA
jgi:hypothetical protein